MIKTKSALSDNQMVVRAIKDSFETKWDEYQLKKYASTSGELIICEGENIGWERSFLLALKDAPQADYYAFADQDDIWYNNKVETSYKRIKAIEEINGKSCPILVHTNSRIMNYETRTKSLFISDCAKNSSFENSFFNFFVQGSTMLINGSLKREALPFSKEVYLHDRYLHLIAEFIGVRAYIDMPTMDYRQHSNNEIGSRGTNIIKRLIFDRYFNQEDKILFNYLHNCYKNKIQNSKIEKINIFFNIINTKCKHSI